MMKKDIRTFVNRLCICLCAICIPALLILDGIHASKYVDLEKQVSELEEKQKELIEQNKKLITDITLLSSSDRIEMIAKEELGMHVAETDEIVRVSVSQDGVK